MDSRAGVLSGKLIGVVIVFGLNVFTGVNPKMWLVTAIVLESGPMLVSLKDALICG